MINNSSNIHNCKDKMNLINNYFSNIHNINNQQKYKLSKAEALLKLDKIILSTNSSNSKKIMKEKIFPPTVNKLNVMYNKKQREKKGKINKNLKNKINQALSSNKIINKNKIKSHFLKGQTYIGHNNITFLSNKYIENYKLKNIMNKINKKKSFKKNNSNFKKIDFQNNNNNKKENENNSNNDESNKIHNKPQSHRNYFYTKKLSGNNTNTKKRINNSNNNSNKNKKKIAKIGLKHSDKQNSQKVISSPCSLNNSSINYFFQYKAPSQKNSINTLDKHIKKHLNENKKKKIINTYNIVNNIQDNSTQINIYTGNNLYKSLHIQNKSAFNSSNNTPANNSSKSPTTHGRHIKNRKNAFQVIRINNNCFRTILMLTHICANIVITL